MELANLYAKEHHFLADVSSSVLGPAPIFKQFSSDKGAMSLGIRKRVNKRQLRCGCRGRGDQQRGLVACGRLHDGLQLHLLQLSRADHGACVWLDPWRGVDPGLNILPDFACNPFQPHWLANKEPMLAFLEEADKMVRGIVTDGVSLPIAFSLRNNVCRLVIRLLEPLWGWTRGRRTWWQVRRASFGGFWHQVGIIFAPQQFQQACTRSGRSMRRGAVREFRLRWLRAEKVQGLTCSWWVPNCNSYVQWISQFDKALDFSFGGW